MKITKHQLKRIFPKANDEFITFFTMMINSYADQFKINTPIQLARYLAQVKNELGFYKDGRPRIHENLNYKRKQLKIFSRTFRNNVNLLDKAMSLKGKSKQKFIAINWYGQGKKAKILGNKKPIDGWIYRGYGLFQVTGRSNHLKVWKVVEKIMKIKVFGKDKEVLPSLLDNLFGAIITSFAFWYVTKMYNCRNSYCVINKINGGLNNIYKEKRRKDAINIYKLLLR